MVPNSEFNQKLLKEIRKRLPRKGQLLNFLLEEMSLGKESAYRRLRGDVPFSFAEACILSERLNLSLDNIANDANIKNRRPSFLFHIPPPAETPEDYVYYYMQTYNICEILLNRWTNDPSITIHSACNIVPQALTLSYPYLSKFRAFVWRYQMHSSPTPTKFSAINFPDSVIARQEVLSQRIKQFPNLTFIISRHIFSTLIKLIRYFVSLNLITQKEVLIMRSELSDLLTKIEYFATHERRKRNGRFSIYVSNINFDSNYTYVKGRKFERAFIELYLINTISTSDPKICKSQRNWIDSLMKYSTLISTSKNAERIAFFEEQRKLINSLLVFEYNSNK